MSTRDSAWVLGWLHCYREMSDGYWYIEIEKYPHTYIKIKLWRYSRPGLK